MESHGLRLAPSQWRKIEAIAASKKIDRSAWLREQIDALLSRIPDMPDRDEKEHNGHAQDVAEFLAGRSA